MFREPNESRIPTRGIKHPALFWGGLAGLLVIMALLVPTEWTAPFADLLGEEQNPKVGAWNDRTDAIDQKLRAGEPLDLTDAELAEVRADLQVRRLFEAGPMNVEDARKAESIFRDFNQRIAAQELPGSRDALRAERNKQLAQALPRLDREEMEAALEKLREQIRASRR
ncbi:MAG: hypothetical protein ACQEVA_16625 [Myxococcota bacterium]